MARVRVPKELRPPSRYEFTLPSPFMGHEAGTFRVLGVFREPNRGEYYWGDGGGPLKCSCGGWHGSRVILEKAP